MKKGLCQIGKANLSSNHECNVDIFSKLITVTLALNALLIFYYLSNYVNTFLKTFLIKLVFNYVKYDT